MTFVSDIIRFLEADERLRKPHAEVVEYAHIYMLAKQRKAGCEGTGEFAMLREEFKDAVEALIRYCHDKNYPIGDGRYELDAVAKELWKP